MLLLRAMVLLFSFPLHHNAIAVDARHSTVYNYSLVDSKGVVVPLTNYKGKTLIIVNLASASVYHRQIAELEALQRLYRDKGLIVLGIPSTDFGKQELTDNAAIQQYYTTSEHTTFMIFSRSTVRGKEVLPLISFLTDPKTGLPGGEIHWNFTKFLIDREGQPVLRFEADTSPADPQFRVLLEKVIDGTFKKKDAKIDASTPGKEGDDDDE